MNCEHKETKVTEKVFSNGTTHLEERCATCNKWLRFKPQSDTVIFYFGKYKGKKVDEIDDIEYLKWLFKNGDLGSRLRKAIALKLGYPQ